MRYLKNIRRPLKVCLSAVLLMALCVFCTDKSAPVDSTYIESKQFQEFKTELTKENSIRLDIQNLPSLLQQFKDCAMRQELTLPIQFNHTDIAFHKSGNTNICNDLTESFNLDYRISFLGYTTYNSLVVRWVLIGTTFSYQNRRFAAVVYQNNKLLNVQQVGIFQNNVHRKVTTEISIDSVDQGIQIISRISRENKYPIRQAEVSYYSYLISRDGTIIEE